MLESLNLEICKSAMFLFVVCKTPPLRKLLFWREAEGADSAHTLDSLFAECGCQCAFEIGCFQLIGMAETLQIASYLHHTTRL